MKSIIPIVLSILTVSASALAQDADIEKALTASPANLKAGATVIKWKADFTYDTLRKGSNKLVCYDRSDQPGQAKFAAECTSLANLPRAAQNLKFEAQGDKKQALLDAAEKDGTREKPEYGSVWYHVRGPDAQHLNTHVTIAVPGATGKSLGLPESGAAGSVWVMNPGTSTAHLMTPGE